MGYVICEQPLIQGLIAPKGLDCLKALFPWKFENKPPEGGEGEEGREKH